MVIHIYVFSAFVKNHISSDMYGASIVAVHGDWKRVRNYEILQEIKKPLWILRLQLFLCFTAYKVVSQE